MWPNDVVVLTPDLLLSAISLFQDLKSDHIFVSVPVAPPIPAMKTGFSLCGNTTKGKPCSGPVLALYGIAVQLAQQSCCPYYYAHYHARDINKCPGHYIGKKIL